MTCRCGHHRRLHQRKSGRKHYPCWAWVDRTRSAHKRGGGLCRCRNFTPIYS